MLVIWMLQTNDFKIFSTDDSHADKIATLSHNSLTSVLNPVPTAYHRIT